jgi:hypothetical protein
MLSAIFFFFLGVMCLCVHVRKCVAWHVAAERATQIHAKIKYNQSRTGQTLYACLRHRDLGHQNNKALLNFTTSLDAHEHGRPSRAGEGDVLQKRP